MSSKKSLQTEFKFTLPRGLLDDKGHLHRQGLMRLATAKDEIYIYKDRRVKENPAYAVLAHLSRSIVRLGSLSAVSPQQLENLYVLDLAYLREFYNRINQHGDACIAVECPHCKRQYSVELELSEKC
ncbi:MAG: phage tail assembly protein [Prochloraceae cyanobacterium]|nr:phage tail assembly protein [Prochloraceae cyanobacterium]